MTADTIPELRRQRYNATVVYLAKPNPELMILRVRPDFPRPDHLPGQYTTLGLGLWEPRYPGSQDEILKPGDEKKVVRRAYSISCSIIDDDKKLLDIAATDWLEFYIVLVKDSGNPDKPPALTPRLFMLREGDRIQLGEKIAGHFTLQGVRPTDTVVFLATGTGEAPHNYMLWQLLRDRHPGRIVSACCARYRRDLAYTAIHRYLESQYSNYTYLSLTTREDLVDGRKVYIQDLLTSGQLEETIGHPLNPESSHVFLCGNPKMIGVPTKDPATGQRVLPQPPGVIEILEQRGFRCDNPAAKERGNIHYEEFW
jgi:ferredoxin--NADP+ reductase